MDSDAFNAVAIDSRNRAEDYARAKNFGRAFSHYLVALTLNPSWKRELKETLSAVLCEWGYRLEREGRHDDLLRCYERAIEVFPDNEFVLNNLGSHLLRYGLIKEAAHYFRKSLDVEPRFLRPARNLENLSNLVVQRWHFRMLNDSKRNAAFREALRKRRGQQSGVVIDIGTGTGLLSLYASEAGFDKVIACDSSQFMTDVAHEVIRENNARGIRVINKHSTELRIPDDVPERVGLVVTEILDCGLLGEHVLETLIDAWDRLLLPADSNPSGCVVPCGAAIFISAVECDSVRRRNFLLDAENCHFEDCVIASGEESYDSECLKSIPSDVAYLTEAKKTIFVDFNDPERMKKLRAGELDQVVTLKVIQRGRLDCFAVWFDLFVDKDIVLNTGPDSDSSDAWDQAIFPASRNVCVDEGEEIEVEVSFARGKLLVRESTRKFASTDKKILRPSPEVVKFLNSHTYKNCFADAVARNVLPLPVSILDAFPFPHFGLNYLIKRGHRGNRLIAVARTRGDRELIEFAAKKHNLEKQVRCVSEDDLTELDESESFDVILLSLVEQTGEIKDGVVEKLNLFKSMLKPGGLFFPEKVVIMGELIESRWLDKMSRVVNDEVTHGHSIADFINMYQVGSHIDFDLASIPKIDRSEAFECGCITSGSHVRDLKVPVVAEGRVNAMVYWFGICFAEGRRCQISTLGDSVTKQSALLLPETRVSGFANVRLSYQNGLLKIESVR